MRVTLGTYRIVFGFALTSVCLAPACSNLIGLSGYGVAGSGGTSDIAGSGNDAGSEEPVGRAGAGAGGSAGSAASAGIGGDAGAPSECPTDCADDNDCTVDSCNAGECVHHPVEAGTRCGVGRTCDTQAVCVRCRDTAMGEDQDEGCSAAAPVCLGAGVNAICSGCTNDGDCNDGNECTTEVCTDNRCVFTVLAQGEACTGGVCNGVQTAPKCGPCETQLITATTGNGSFETPGPAVQSAKGWVDSSENYYLIYDNADGPFAGATGSTAIKPGNGSYFAWLGGPVDAGVTSLTTALMLPAGAKTLTVLADTNFQTKNATAANHDSFQVRLLDATTDEQIGSPVYAATNADAQTGTLHAWTGNGINKTVDVTALGGKQVNLMFWASVDTLYVSDFFLDNVRVSVNVCQ